MAVATGESSASIEYGLLGRVPSPHPRGTMGRMKADTKKDVATRLKSIAGHLKAVERMVDEDTYCVDVLKQTMAIEKALERVDAVILGSHLETCVADAFREGRAAKTVKELADIFSTARK